MSKNLDKLIEVLEDVKAKQKPFDLGAWFGLTGDAEDYIGVVEEQSAECVITALEDDGVVIGEGCGTVACACGWAAVYPQFKDAPISAGNTTAKDRKGNLVTVPDFDWPDVCRTFGVNIADADYLFSQYSYTQRNPSIDDVINRVKTFISENG